MSVFLHHLETHVPRYAYSQLFARDLMKSWFDDRRTQRLIHAIFNRSGIETRHSVSGDFVEGEEAQLFRMDESGRLVSPTTQERNDLYSAEARGLAVELGKKLLAGAERFGPEDVTHVIFASCTGFCNPGPDYYLVRDLGLRESTERYILGFMGCYAAFPALRMAKQFCEADPDAVVMVMCLELCSLHLQPSEEPDLLLANSLFADGAGAALVSAKPPREGDHGFRLDKFVSALVPAGEADMAWDIGNHGFNIVLSSYVPEILGTEVGGLLAATLEKAGISLEEIDAWAVHPGGRAILDKVAEGLDLAAETMDAPRDILRRYGNMSSATILFVLKEMLERSSDPAKTLAMAFGPGLTVETALLERY
ncbi:MAG: type III polyketide synthase [Verrucomicrobiae bacterium]|nr:type III polyketide synthase [Verrucomicrobiae bacterium]